MHILIDIEGMIVCYCRNKNNNNNNNNQQTTRDTKKMKKKTANLLSINSVQIVFISHYQYCHIRERVSNWFFEGYHQNNTPLLTIHPRQYIVKLYNHIVYDVAYR